MSSSWVCAKARGHQVGVERDVFGAAVVAVGVHRPQLDPRKRLAAVTDHEVPLERIDSVESHVVAVLDQRAERGGIADRSLDEREVLRAVVVQDQEPVLTADDRVLDRVLDELAARPHGRELGLRVGGVAVAHLGGDGAARRDDDVVVAAGTADSEPEPLVGLVVDLLGGQPGADAVAPDGVGAPRVVDGGVVDGAVVGRPGDAGADADDLVVVQLAGA